MRRIAVALAAFALMASVPVSAQSGYLGPRGAAPDGCKHVPGHPDCRPDRTYYGRSVAISGEWGYNHYAYGPNCLRYGYPPNCAYWELPDWNGGMEIRNPGGG
jgi:hypothetical protein